MSEVSVTSFYRFLPLSEEQVQALKQQLEEFAARTGLRGLCLLGHEGINATLSADAATVSSVKELVAGFLNVADIHFKDSVTDRHPFHLFKVKIKNEIVTLGRPALAPTTVKNGHLSPEEWHQALQDPATVVIDTRNDYEVEIGKFRSAIDFGLKEFREFPSKLQEAALPKDSKVLIYCTGGIRCEKAILEMHEQGYQNVHQLDGGILNYLEKFPEQEFEGDCFVFDYRVAVDQKLQASSKYKLCPHCGQPARETVKCKMCGADAIVCKHCVDGGAKTCSKNCAHHARLGSRSRRRQKLAYFDE